MLLFLAGLKLPSRRKTVGGARARVDKKGTRETEREVAKGPTRGHLRGGKIGVAKNVNNIGKMEAFEKPSRARETLSSTTFFSREVRLFAL